MKVRLLLRRGRREAKGDVESGWSNVLPPGNLEP